MTTGETAQENKGIQQLSWTVVTHLYHNNAAAVPEFQSSASSSAAISNFLARKFEYPAGIVLHNWLDEHVATASAG